jgi:hypothetical protein
MRQSASVLRLRLLRGILLLSTLAAIFLSGASSSGSPVAGLGSSCEPFVPCTDHDGCPDLVVDGSFLSGFWSLERRTFTTEQCAVIEGEIQAGDRWLLRFPSATPNLGPGDLIIGRPTAHPEWFDFQTCHGHPHFKEYADYRLWTTQGYVEWTALRQAHPGVCASNLLNANPRVAAEMIQGRKQGFCVGDVFPTDLGPCHGERRPSKHYSCDRQGISVCWADIYRPQLDGQWIDVTGLRGGDYVLEEEVNAEHFFEEADYANNSSAVTISLPTLR